MRKSLFVKLAAAMAVACLLAPSAYAYYTATVTATITMSAGFSENVASGFPTPLTAAQSVSQTDSYTSSGTGSGQVDTCYATQLSLVASTPQTIDLTNLKDPLGNSITFARVREFIVQNTTTTAGFDCAVYAAASNGWSVLPPTSNKIYCRYGSVLRISDKLSTGTNNGNVVGSTSKVATFDPGANAVTVNVWIIGGSSQ